jgi:hypothetical protein
MGTNIILTNLTVNATSGSVSELHQFISDPPKAFVQLALILIVSWAFRHVVERLGDRLKRGNGAQITVMLCMCLMWVYGFLETSIQQCLKTEADQNWWSHPLVFACAGSFFMLFSMWIHIKCKGKDDEPPKDKAKDDEPPKV